MADDFAEEVRELWTQAEDADDENRREALLDLEFAAPTEKGGHWDPQVRRYREQVGIERYGFPLPCLTINTVPQFVGQVIGDRRANQTSIKVLPSEDGDVKVAEVRGDIIRSIELKSRADRVRATAFEQQVTCGIGHTRIDLDYANDDTFNRDLLIRSIPNPMSVLWDPLAADPTGRDASYCFVADRLTKDEFEKRYPDAEPLTFNAKGIDNNDWFDGEFVRVAEYWKIEERPQTIAQLKDGSTVKLTGKKADASLPVALKPDGSKMIRTAKCKYATMVMTNGSEELTTPFELEIPRVPIIRWMGRETWVGERRVRFGLVRYMRDPARLKDYNRSVRAELLMLMPRANFIAQASAIEGRESDWPNTLRHNDGTEPPVPITAQLASLLLEEANMFSNDMKETTGIHEAELGMASNETSGVAIQRRQQQGDVAAIVYHDNGNAAMQEEGEILNRLLNVAIDTPRTVRSVASDGTAKMVRVNDPQHPDNVDLLTGDYDVTISTGPAYATRRQEQAQQLLTLSAENPQFAAVVPDYIVRSLDIEHADEMAERFKRTIPPQILGDDANDGKSPEEMQVQQQKAMQAQQVQEMGLQLEMQGKQADVALKQAQATEAQAKAELAQAQALKAKTEAMSALTGQPDPSVDAETQRTAILGYNAETQRLATLMKGNMPGTPPLLAQHLAPIIANAIGQALAKQEGFAPVELGLPTAPPLAPVDSTASDNTIAPGNDQGLAA